MENENRKQKDKNKKWNTKIEKIENENGTRK